MKWSLSYDKPLAIRYPKGEDCVKYDVHSAISLGKWEYLTSDDADAVILATGAVCVANAVKAAKILKDKGINISVINARFIKPFDCAILDAIAGKKIFTIEDGVRTGGFGEGVTVYYAGKGINADVNVIAFDESPYPQGSLEHILAVTGTDPDGIARKIIQKVKS